MAVEGPKGGLGGCRRIVGPGPLSVHALVCLGVFVLSLRSAAGTPHCTEPTVVQVQRRHLDVLSSIASHILSQQLQIAESVTDAELQSLLDRMRLLEPSAVEAYDTLVTNEYNREMELWIWRCRSQQTLGRRRRRESRPPTGQGSY